MRNNLFKLSVIILAVLSLSLAGCETLKKKFTRPPKAHKKAPMAVVEGGAAQTYPNYILYQNHYVLWKVWQDELINSLEGNQKKKLECAYGALSELRSMRRWLNEEGQAAVEPFILELENMARRAENTSLSFSSIKQLKNDLSQHKTRIEKKFHYHKVNHWIKPDKAAIPNEETSSEIHRDAED